MRSFLFLAFLISCAHEPQVDRPHWVEAVRSGEEALRVTHGNKTFYRRIAGSPDVTKQTACNLVIMKAEEDLRKEYPNEKVPYAVEVLYYDEEHRDCAVTISTSKFSEAPQVDRKVAHEDEASDLVLNRSEVAARFALTGLTREEFEKFANDKVTVIDEENICTKYFRTHTYSIHGLTHICWKGEVIAGYCTQKDKQCWTRIP